MQDYIQRSPLYLGSIFNLAEWRHFLSYTVMQINPHIEVICPFGFEVSQNWRYLQSDIRNFYVYLGSYHDNHSSDLDCEQISELLVAGLKRFFPDFYSDVLKISLLNKVWTVNENAKKCIYIKHRFVKSPLLHEYAHYILASPNGILSSRIKAARHFSVDPLSRRYLFQLTLILNYVFRREGLELSVEHEGTLRYLIRELHKAEAIQLLRDSTPATSVEMKTKDSIVLPFLDTLVQHMKATVSSDDKLINVVVGDFHGTENLEADIMASILDEKTCYISETYLQYGSSLSKT